MNLDCGATILFNNEDTQYERYFRFTFTKYIEQMDKICKKNCFYIDKKNSNVNENLKAHATHLP